MVKMLITTGLEEQHIINNATDNQQIFKNIVSCKHVGAPSTVGFKFCFLLYEKASCIINVNVTPQLYSQSAPPGLIESSIR